MRTCSPQTLTYADLTGADYRRTLLGAAVVGAGIVEDGCQHQPAGRYALVFASSSSEPMR